VTSGLQLAVGSRLGPIGGLIETQFAQDQEGARMSDLNAQLRIYLPLGDHAEVYPLLALGQANLLSSRSASHLDLGIGAQFNVNRHLAVGARYSARLIADKVNGDPTNGHNLTAQIAVRF
jgi:opacity protein-like surface antigen